MTKLLDIEIVRQAFIDKGVTPTFTEYVSSKKDLSFICKCGNESEMAYQYVKYSGRTPKCPDCKLGKPPPFKEVQQLFIDKGVTPLFKKYVTNHDPLLFKCKCGNEHSIRYIDIKYHDRTPKCPNCYKYPQCHNNEQPTLKEVRQVFIDKGSVPLFTEYKNSKKPLLFRCPCGDKYKMTYGQLKHKNQNPRCPKCNVRSRPHPLKEAQQLFIDSGVTPLFTEYKHSHIPLPFKCKCGNEHKVSYNSLSKLKRRGKAPRCTECISKDLPRGKTHVHYKHDMSDYERKYGRIRSKAWKTTVLRRDNHTCVISGIKGKGKVCAHHIYNFADHTDLREVPENGITLSKGIHKEFHKVYGKANNTIDQFSEFYQTKTGDTFQRDYSLPQQAYQA